MYYAHSYPPIQLNLWRSIMIQLSNQMLKSTPLRGIPQLHSPFHFLGIFPVELELTVSSGGVNEKKLRYNFPIQILQISLAEANDKITLDVMSSIRSSESDIIQITGSSKNTIDFINIGEIPIIHKDTDIIIRLNADSFNSDLSSKTCRITLLMAYYSDTKYNSRFDWQCSGSNVIEMEYTLTSYYSDKIQLQKVSGYIPILRQIGIIASDPNISEPCTLNLDFIDKGRFNSKFGEQIFSNLKCYTRTIPCFKEVLDDYLSIQLNATSISDPILWFEIAYYKEYNHSMRGL